MGLLFQKKNCRDGIMEKKMDDLWCVEYSKSQGCVHIDKFEKIITMNRNMFMIGNSNDYQIIGVYSTYEEASKAIKMLGEEMFL